MSNSVRRTNKERICCTYYFNSFGDQFYCYCFCFRKSFSFKMIAYMSKTTWLGISKSYSSNRFSSSSWHDCLKPLILVVWKCHLSWELFFYSRFGLDDVMLNSFDLDDHQTPFDIAFDWQEKDIQMLGKSISFLQPAKNNQKKIFIRTYVWTILKN